MQIRTKYESYGSADEDNSPSSSSNSSRSSSGGGGGAQRKGSDDGGVSSTTSFSSESGVNAKAEADVFGDTVLGIPILKLLPRPTHLTILQVAAIAFFLTGGGPYGLEVTVKAAGPLFSFIGYAAMPLLFSTPQALMTAEMSAMFPENAGSMVWVYRGLGDFAGYINSFNRIFANMVDNSIYPVLFMDYISEDLPTLASFLIKATVVGAGVVCNLLGVSTVGNLSSLFSLLVLVPFTVMFFIVLPQVDPGTQWTGTVPPQDVDWSLFLSTLMWAHTGWDSLGNLAAEVERGSHVFPIGIGITMLTCFLSYTIPMAAALTQSTTLSDWSAGYYATAGKGISRVLGGTITTSGMVSNLAVHIVALSATSRALASLGDRPPSARLVPAVLSKHSKTRKAPYVAIWVQGIVAMILMNFDFDRLIRISTYANVIALVLEFISFLTLRHRRPDLERPFRVPGGFFGAYLITIPKVLLVLAVLVLADGPTLAVCLGLNLLLAVSYPLNKRFCRGSGRVEDDIAWEEEARRRMQEEAEEDDAAGESDGAYDESPVVVAAGACPSDAAAAAGSNVGTFAAGRGHQDRPAGGASRRGGIRTAVASSGSSNSSSRHSSCSPDSNLAPVGLCPPLSASRASAGSSGSESELRRPLSPDDHSVDREFERARATREKRRWRQQQASRSSSGSAAEKEAGTRSAGSSSSSIREQQSVSAAAEVAAGSPALLMDALGGGTSSGGGLSSDSAGPAAVAASTLALAFASPPMGPSDDETSDRTALLPSR